MVELGKKIYFEIVNDLELIKQNKIFIGWIPGLIGYSCYFVWKKYHLLCLNDY